METKNGSKLEIAIGEMGSWERKKAMFILDHAEALGMDIDGYGQIAVNPNSGYTYLWLEDYNFTLYMPINCELQVSDISALWTNSENGEEIEYELTNTTTLENLEDWATQCEKSEVTE